MTMTAEISEETTETTSAKPERTPRGRKGKAPKEPKAPREVKVGGGILTKIAGTAPGFIQGLAIRLGTICADILLVTTTTTTIMPMLAMFLHEQSGAAQNALSTEGLVALWIVPLVFAMAMIFAAEYAGMRWLWRAGSRRIAKNKLKREGAQAGLTTAAKSAASKNPKKRK